MKFLILLFVFLVPFSGCKKGIKKEQIKKDFEQQDLANKNSEILLFNLLHLKKEQILSLSTPEIAKLITAIVYKHCTSEPPHTEKLTDLFKECRTSCGGYAYLAVSLLRSLGINARYVNIFNMPNQGNHSLLEVELQKNKYALLDPTFGTYFGSQSMLSLPEVLSLSEEGLKREVRQVKDKNFSYKEAFQNIDLFYDNKFNAPWMSLSNYITYETAQVHGEYKFINLALTLDMNGKRSSEWGTFNGSFNERVLRFLQITNDSLNNAIAGDEVSFNYSYTGISSGNVFRNIIKLKSLKEKRKYILKISGHALTKGTLSLTKIDGKLVIDRSEFVIGQLGPFELQTTLFPLEGNVVLMLEGDHNSEFSGRFWGINIKELNNAI